MFFSDYAKNRYYEICSFSDSKKYFQNPWATQLNTYHDKVLSRVYPAAHRYDSLNYDPTPFWDSGFQLVALNYQTPGITMNIKLCSMHLIK